MNKEILKILQDYNDSPVFIKSICTLLFWIDNKLCNIDEVSEDDVLVLRKLRLVEKDYSTGEIILRKPLYDNNCSSTIGEQELSEWVEKYRNLVYVNGNRKPFKLGASGDKHDILRKIKKFLKLYPMFSLEDVYNTYKYYIQENIRNPNYIPEAGYFLFKDNRSLCAALVEEYKNSYKNTETNEWL